MATTLQQQVAATARVQAEHQLAIYTDIQLGLTQISFGPMDF